jgi:hypothetical protein
MSNFEPAVFAIIRQGVLAFFLFLIGWLMWESLQNRE